MWKPVMMEQMMYLPLTESPQKSLSQVTLLTSISQYSLLCPFCLFCSRSPRRSSGHYWDNTDIIVFSLLLFKTMLCILFCRALFQMPFGCGFDAEGSQGDNACLSITTQEADSPRLVGVGARSSRSNRERIEHWHSSAFANFPRAIFYIKLKPDFSQSLQK